MKQKTFFLIVLVMLMPLTILGADSEGTSENVNVTEAGTLRELVADLKSTDIRQLKISGNINAADIKYLREGAGRLANLELLNIKDVTLIPSDEPYYTFGVTFDMLWSYGSYSVYISDHTSTTDLGLLDWYTHGYRIDSDGLAYAFTETNLKTVVLPSTMKRIGEGAFKNCCNLESVEVPEGIQAVDEQAFWKCSQLQLLNLSTQLTNIGESAFSDCTSLTTIGHIENVTEMGNGAFSECSSFTGNALGVLDISSLSSVPIYAFYNCAFNEIAFSSSLIDIGEYGFSGCKNLTTVTLPSSTESIGHGAFSCCESLVEVILPNTLAIIGNRAFSDTPWYENLQPIDNVIYVGNVAEKIGPLTEGTILTIREGTTGIANEFTYQAKSWYSDQYKGAIIGINLPSTLQYIGDKAFANCENITQIDLPEGLKNIGEGAFSGCKGLAKADLPTSLKVIGNSAFEGCSLKQITISESIDSIGDEAFCKNSSLITVSYNAPNAKGMSIFSECSGLEKVTIGAQVKVLPEYLFNKCSNLMRLNFEERTEGQTLDIYNCAFSECTNLDNVNFPLGIDSIANGAFYGCKLTSLDIPEGVKIIENSAFGNCKTVTLTLPKSLEKCGDYCFSGMTNLKTLYFNPKQIESTSLLSGNTSLEKVIVGSEVQFLCGFGKCENLKELDFLPRLSNCCLEIESEAFLGCHSLQAISLPEGTTSIGRSAFEDCVSALSLTLPSTLESIGYRAFMNAFAEDGFSELVLPNTIKHLGYGAFYENPNIKKVFYDVENGDEPGNVGTKASSYVGVLGGMNALEELVIGKHVRQLPKFMLRYSYNIKKITSEERTENDVPLTSDAYTFDDCNVKSIEFPLGTKDIAGLPYLDYLYIPKTVEKLGFSFHCGVTELYYDARCADAHINNCQNMTIGKHVEKIPKDFYGFSNTENSLYKLEFEPRADNTPLEIEDNAFRYVTGVSSCFLPRGTTRIGNNAFENSTISMFVIPESVTSIGENAFNSISESKVTILNYQKKPLLLAADLMNEKLYARSKSKLLVPMGSKEKYQSANIWKKFNIEEFDATTISPLKGNMASDFEQLKNDCFDIGFGNGNVIIDDVYYGNGMFWNEERDDRGQRDIYSLTFSSLKPASWTFDEIQKIWRNYGISIPLMYNTSFYGILFEISEGEGTLTLDSRTYGNRKLMVKIGDSEPQEFLCDERDEVVVNCHVYEPTLVYIYSDDNLSESNSGSNSEIDNYVQLYGFKWLPKTSRIDDELIENPASITPSSYYSLDGKRLASPQKGLNIIRMSDGTIKKVVIN